MVADIMTKPLARPQFERLRSMMGLVYLDPTVQGATPTTFGGACGKRVEPPAGIG